MQRLCITAMAALVLTASLADAQTRRTSVDLSREEVLPTAVTSAPLIPIGQISYFPSNSTIQHAQDWLECNGQQIPPGTKYDQLRAFLGSNSVPNYTDQFLRPTTDPSKTGTTVADSIKSHTVDVPGQSADVTANLDNTDVHGVAASQSYAYQWTGEAPAAVITSAPNATVGLDNLNNTHQMREGSTSGGSIAGNVTNGKVTGKANVQPTTGTYSGASETAPLHTYVKAYIRAVQ